MTMSLQKLKIILYKFLLTIKVTNILNFIKILNFMNDVSLKNMRKYYKIFIF